MTKIETLIAKMKWNDKERLANWLNKHLQGKPKKRGYAFCVRGVLNAYREGDLTFIESTEAIIKYINNHLDKVKSDIEDYVKRDEE